VVNENGDLEHFSGQKREDHDPRNLPDCFKVFHLNAGFNLNIDKLIKIYEKEDPETAMSKKMQDGQTIQVVCIKENTYFLTNDGHVYATGSNEQG